MHRDQVGSSTCMYGMLNQNTSKVDVYVFGIAGECYTSINKCWSNAVLQDAFFVLELVVVTCQKKSSLSVRRGKKTTKHWSHFSGIKQTLQK